MIKRNISAEVLNLAQQYPVLTITGPRQSGKTTLCKALFPEKEYVSLENPDLRHLAQNDPRGFLAKYSEGAIFDEIQRTPDLPSYLQEIVDREKKPGMFILTGSQQFEVIDSVNQSLAGRTAMIKLLPFSFDEIYKDEKIIPPLEKILFQGFYPRIHDQQLNPTQALSFYFNTYIERDLRALMQIKDLNTFERFVGLCAANCGQILNLSRFGNDCGIDQKTVKSWISILEASYIVFLLKPHHQNFRKRLVKSPKIYFYDVGLAAYLLGIHDPKQLEKHPLRGPLFETFIVSEIIKMRYNAIKNNNLYFFRDNVGNEIDVLLDYSDHVYAIEVKSSETIHKEFFKGLNFYKKINSNIKNKYFLIYGGDKDFKTNQHPVYSYPSLQTIDL